MADKMAKAVFITAKLAAIQDLAKVLVLLPTKVSFDKEELIEIINYFCKKGFTDSIPAMLRAMRDYLKNPIAEKQENTTCFMEFLAQICLVWTKRCTSDKKTTLEDFEIGKWIYDQLVSDQKSYGNKLLMTLSMSADLDLREEFYEKVSSNQKVRFKELLNLSGVNYQGEVEARFVELLQITDLREDPEIWAEVNRRKSQLIKLTSVDYVRDKTQEIRSDLVFD